MVNGMMNGNIPVKPKTTCPMDKKTLMLEIYKYGFVVDDLKLYLDTHKNDEKALECFEEAREKYEDAVKNYTKLYGPLLVSMYEPNCKWNWNQGPMPWEGEV